MPSSSSATRGFDASWATVDVSSRRSVHELVGTAATCCDVVGVIHAAGVSPSEASPPTIFAVDLYGTAVVLDELGSVIAPGGSGIVIASQACHRLAALTPDHDAALATTPDDEPHTHASSNAGTLAVLAVADPKPSTAPALRRRGDLGRRGARAITRRPRVLDRARRRTHLRHPPPLRPAAAIFAIVTDPAGQVAIDGSHMLVAAPDADPPLGCR